MVQNNVFFNENLFVYMLEDNGIFENSLLQYMHVTNNTNSTFRMKMISATLGTISFTVTALYMLYVILRTIYSFPWITLFRFCTRSSRRGQVSLKELWFEIKTKCFIIYHPIARIFFCFQFYQLTADSVHFFAFSNYKDNKVICYYEFVLIQVFGVGLFMWAFMISIWMVCILVLKIKKLLPLELISHSVVILVAVALAIVPIATDSIGDAGGYCWIKPNGFHKYIRLTYYIPLLLVVSAMTIVYFITMIVLIRRQCLILNQSGRKKNIADLSSSVQIYSKLLGFPILLITVYICASLRLLMELIVDTKNPKYANLMTVLDYLNLVTMSSVGFFCTALFVFSDLLSFYLSYRRSNIASDVDVQTENELEGIDYAKWQDENTESAIDEL